MYEQLVEIATPSGAMETFITRPQDGGPFAPVILYRTSGACARNSTTSRGK